MEQKKKRLLSKELIAFKKNAVIVENLDKDFSKKPKEEILDFFSERPYVVALQNELMNLGYMIELNVLAALTEEDAKRISCNVLSYAQDLLGADHDWKPLYGGFPAQVQDMSEIELLIIERIMIVCVNLLREPWENVADIHPRLERIETNSQYAQIISPSEMIAIVTINLKIGEVEGLMNVCLPYLTLEDVIDKLNTKYWYSNLQNQDNTDYTESIETLIRRAQIPIKAVLGNSMISVNDFAMLQPGDIIRLDRKVEDELDIYVGNIRKFTALPGSSGDKYAVRVTSVIREEQ